MSTWASQAEGPSHLSRTILAACLLALQVSEPQALTLESPTAASQQALTKLLPLLSEACNRGGPAAAPALALLTAVAGKWLPLSDWLPIVQSRLDLTSLLQEGLSSLSQLTGQEEAGKGHVLEEGVMSLLLALASTQEGARLAYESGVLQHLLALSRWLLRPGGGLLGLLDATPQVWLQLTSLAT